jgi:hypothetical protein
MIKAQQSWVKHRDTPKYKEGDQVWLDGKNGLISLPPSLRPEDMALLESFMSRFQREGP